MDGTKTSNTQMCYEDYQLLEMSNEEYQLSELCEENYKFLEMCMGLRLTTFRYM